MSDLNALKNQFMSLQKRKSSFKLSERTVVEIIMKISNRGKVNLLHTTSGKEYVVNEKVNIEIINEIKKRKRVTIFELSSYLELPINIIEAKVNDLIAKNKNYILVDGKIMIKEYLDKITKEINDLVFKQGSASIAEISNKYDLSIDFLKTILKEKITEGELKAKLYPTRIITDYYIQSQIKKIRPLLLANINPITVPKILSKYEDIDELLINQIITNLTESGQVKGNFISNQFENALYNKAQESYVIGELKQNNYIDYNKLKNIGINKNGEEFIKGLIKSNCNEIKNGIFLKDYYITDELKNNLMTTIKDNESKNLPTNLENELLLNLDEEDINILLESMDIQDRDYIYINYNYIPTKIIEDFIENQKKFVNSNAERKFNEYVKKMEEEKEKTNDEEKEKEKEEEKDANKKKRGGKGNKGGKDKGNNTNKNNIKYDIKFNKSEINEIENLFMDLPCFEYINDKRSTLKDIYDDKIIPKIKSIFDGQIKELIKLKEKQQNQVDIISHIKQLDNLYIYLKLIYDNINRIENNFKTEEEKRALNGLITHLCRNDANTLVKDLMIYLITKNKLTIDNKKLSTVNEREKIIYMLPDEETRNAITNLNNYVDDKKFHEFMKELENLIKIKNIELSPYDTNKEKEQINRIKNEILKEIKESGKEKSESKTYFKNIIKVFNYLLMKKELFFKLPNENWIFNVCKIIFDIPIFKHNEEFDFCFNEFYSLIKDKKNLDDLYKDNKQKFQDILTQIKEFI